jgi:hypothetical protein
MPIVKMAVCSGFMVLCEAITAHGEVACNREPIAMLLSPDNAWVALVHEGECSDGGFANTSTDVVKLVRREAIGAVELAPSPDRPDHENDVLVLDYYGHFEYRPVLKWLSARELQLTVPNISAIGLQKTSYQDVTIVVRYEPDNPTAREKWRKENRLPPNP